MANDQTTYYERARDTGGGAFSSFLHGRNPRTGRKGRYAAIVALEYVACMLMIALSAGFVPKENKDDILAAPVVAMVRLTAVSILFFGLALLSTGEHLGRLAAAFGGLVTCGIAINATAEWKALAALFPSPSSTSSSSTGGAANRHSGGSIDA